MRRMNILVINHYAGSPGHGMEYRPYYLAREWVRMGHRVHIVAASFSHIRINQPRLSGNRRDEQIDGIHYTWFATPPYSGSGVGRVRNMAAFVMRLFLEAHALTDHFRPDVVIASSTYPMDVWPARRIAKLAAAKLIFEVHDLWPLTPMQLGNMSKWHPFIMLVQTAEDYAYAHADAVVSMLPKAKDYMVSRGMREDKFHYVPNGIDPDEWSGGYKLSKDIAQTLDKLRGNGLPLVGYAGGHSLSNALDILLDTSVLLRGKATVIMVGTGPESERLQQRVWTEGLDNVTMLPAIPKREVPAFLEAVDIAYIGWHRNPLYRFGISPNKLMDYMMAAKPVVHAVDAGNDPVSEANCGITVAPDDVVAISDAVIRLAAMSTVERARLGENGRSFILRKQTYEVLANKFADVLTATPSPTKVSQ